MTKRKVDEISSYLECKYYTRKNIVNNMVRCKHPECYHRKILQKIDKLIEYKNCGFKCLGNSTANVKKNY